MRGIAVFFVTTFAIVATTTALWPTLRCPKRQIVNWKIELLLPHKDCDKFYKCTHGNPVEQVCPSGLFYNIRKWQCDWPQNVFCGFRIKPAPPKESEETEITTAISASSQEEVEIEFQENGCPVSPDVHWLLPHETDCSFYYNCVWGNKVLRNCSSSLQFNKELQVCDWPPNANCVIIS